jgi:hypothetical protein
VEFPNTNGVAAKLDGNGQSGKAIGDDKNLVADGVEKHPPVMETHANRLLNLLNELRSFADQACGRSSQRGRVRRSHRRNYED